MRLLNSGPRTSRPFGALKVAGDLCGTLYNECGRVKRALETLLCELLFVCKSGGRFHGLLTAELAA